MSSSINLYDYLTSNTSLKMMHLNNTEDDHDNGNDNNGDPLIAASPTTMKSSDSNDSAIVSDEVDDSDLMAEHKFIYRNSWSKAVERSDLPRLTTLASLSQSFDILNYLERQTISDNISNNNSTKYKRPLPWLNSTLPMHTWSSSLELTANRVHLFKKNSFNKIHKIHRSKYQIKVFRCISGLRNTCS